MMMKGWLNWNLKNRKVIVKQGKQGKKSKPTTTTTTKKKIIFKNLSSFFFLLHIIITFLPLSSTNFNSYQIQQLYWNYFLKC